jgi:aryl-alcohol dehydrogenase-like predicted oxidoreductase
VPDPTAADRTPLPGTDVAIPPLGVGTWAWGDKSTWGMGGYDADLTEASIREAFDASLAAGVVLFDTAEVYGAGESERIIGRLLKAEPGARDRVVIATKFMPLPQKLNVRRALVSAARASCERMGIETIDLYQLHGPISFRSHDALAEALVTAQSEGLVKAVGVSNYSAKETRKIDEALRKRGTRLATNQIEYSLLRTAPERRGLLATCRELGVVPLAYSPMGQGRLSGKYSAANPPAGKRSFSAHPWERIDAVVAELRRVAEAHDRTPGQAALAWCIAKGTVPIPGAKNGHQAEQNAGALGWSLTAEEVAALDAVALEGVRSLQSRFWQHG